MSPLFDHLRELRRRLIFSLIAWALVSIIAFFIYPRLINLITYPFSAIKHDFSLNFLNLLQMPAMKIKTSLAAGAVLSSPLHLINLLGFVFPGLYAKERRAVLLFLLPSTLIMAGSVYFAYTLLLPYTVRALTGPLFMPQLGWTQVGLMFDLQKNTQIVVQLLAAAMVVFQVPLVLTALMMVGILKRRQVWGALRYVIIGVFVLSAVITPPDLVSQIALAGPLIVLLLLSLLIAKVLRFGEET